MAGGFAHFVSKLASTLSCFQGCFGLQAQAIPIVPPSTETGRTTVVVNGVELDFDDWDKDHALEEIMIHLNVADLETLYIPTTRLEHANEVAPRLYTSIMGETYATTYNSAGALVFKKFPPVFTGKIKYEIVGHLVLKKSGYVFWD